MMFPYFHVLYTMLFCYVYTMLFCYLYNMLFCYLYTMLFCYLYIVLYCYLYTMLFCYLYTMLFCYSSFCSWTILRSCALLLEFGFASLWNYVRQWNPSRLRTTRHVWCRGSFGIEGVRLRGSLVKGKSGWEGFHCICFVIDNYGK